MCEQYGIPLKKDVDSGPLWDARTKAWYSQFVPLPIASGERLLLVPKAIVRTNLQYDSGEYFRHFLLSHMQKAELDANTELVEVIRSGRGRVRRRVTKKALIGKYGSGKGAIVRETRKHPEALARYRAIKRDEKHLPLTLDDIAGIEHTEPPDWDTLIATVRSIPVGQTDSTRYEKAVEGLLTALLYPNLTYPIVQNEIHDGRKRIDITYTNMALNGFFKWVATHYPASHIFVECKNYGREICNPELDQLAGRFSPSRGQVGLLVCRSFQDKPLFMRRCIDTAKDSRGYIIALDDEDLTLLTESRKSEPLYSDWRLLHERFRALVN